VLCSVSSPQFNNNEVVKAAHHFFITICVASGSGEMEVIMSVFETVKKIIVEVTDISGDEIQLESRFEEDLEADSLDVVEMIMLIEEEYEFEIPEEIAETLKTVKDVVDYIEKHLAENA
jgi:acyl carrier protein